MNKRHFCIFLSILLFSNSTYSQRIEKQTIQKPTLIIGIVIEQMRFEYLYRFWDKLSDGGFKKLVLGGAVCRNASADYMYTQTNPGLATIATGTNPCTHGIIADEWYDRIKAKVIGSVTDESETTISGLDKDIQCSPRKILSTTIGDELKTANKLSKVVSISLKSSSSVLLGGHNADAAYWMDETTGEFTTSSYYRTELPTWVKEFNNRKFNDIYLAKTWNTLLPIETYTESLPDRNDYEIGINYRTMFPYQLSLLSDRYRKYKILKTTPMGNSYMKDFAINTIVGENLGKDQYTDLLMLSFSATDAIGLKYGPRSIEIEDTYIRLDKDIEFFLQFIEKELGKQNVLVFLTSTNGTAENPKHMIDTKQNAGQFKQAKAEQLLKTYLNAVYGANDWVSYYNKQVFYLNQTLIEDNKIALNEIQEKSVNFLVKLTGVTQVLSASALQNTNFSDGMPRKFWNNYNQKRSGDIFMCLEPGWIEQTTNETTSHNSPYSYDTHIPLIWYGWKTEHVSITRPISLTDIAPTLSLILKIQKPSAGSGNPIGEIFNDN